MGYILRGNDRNVTNMLKERHIWINRGMIQLVPIFECGLITEEDARRTLECMLAEKNKKIDRLTASIAEKDKAIVELAEEREIVKAYITELEVQIPSDERNLPVADSKDLQEEDAKEVTVTNDKAVSVEDEKKTGKGETSK